MRYVKVGGACLNQTPLNWEQNLRNIVHALQAAQSEGVEVLCLPELCITGYGCEDAFFQRSLTERALGQLAEVALHTLGLTALVGLPVWQGGVLHNMTAVLHNGHLLGFAGKQNLANDGVHYEKRWFAESPKGVWPARLNGDGMVDWGHSEYADEASGLFLPNGLRLGVEICEDAWVEHRPADAMHRPELILNPSASHFAYGKTHLRRNLVTESSRRYACTYVYANLVGNEAGRIIYDGEVLIAQNGELLATGTRFSYRDWMITATVVDLEESQQVWKRRKMGSMVAFPSLPEHASAASIEQNPIIPVPESKAEEFHKAITLGLWDYMRKSHSRGYVLSLSGGADSTTCAIMAAEALRRAKSELTEKELHEKLAYAKLDFTKPLEAQLFSFVYQGTENSGPETLQSAQAVAQEIGAEFHHWDTSGLHKEYLRLAEATIGRPLDWHTDDVALQNIQSRLRSPGVWLLTNVKGALLLTTSNRSEAAVGYATMDGDTSGSLAPLGGADKAFIMTWLKWAEHALGYSSLSYVNNMPPTAELRPASYAQTDETDLMPYPLLQAIEQSAVRDSRSPLETFLVLRSQLADTYSIQELHQGVRKFYTLWARNQWKRERYAPSFHLDDYNLDPRSWCRFPILSGGYVVELAALDSYVKSGNV
jgi:NAD+ synthase (glutamine-hydrolysing)